MKNNLSVSLVFFSFLLPDEFLNILCFIWDALLETLGTIVVRKWAKFIAATYQAMLFWVFAFIIIKSRFMYILDYHRDQ